MKKIMFNDKYGLTLAVLSGKKIQTRRIVKKGTTLGNWSETIKYSRYNIGDIVAIAQAYKDIPKIAEINYLDIDWDRATKNKPFGKWGCANKLPGWSNKMFVRADVMPHYIRITNIRIERLQDISDDDCMAEGVSQIPLVGDYTYDINKVMNSSKFTAYETPRAAYAALIDKVSGRGTWDSNPWVWVYDFELIK